MRVFAHPFRLDGSGAVATIEQGSLIEAGQLAQVVVSTTVGERELAPDFGIPDPSGVGVSAESLVAAVALCEPELAVTDVGIVRDGDTQSVAVTVEWLEGV